MSPSACRVRRHSADPAVLHASWWPGSHHSVLVATTSLIAPVEPQRARWCSAAGALLQCASDSYKRLCTIALSACNMAQLRCSGASPDGEAYFVSANCDLAKRKTRVARCSKQALMHQPPLHRWATTLSQSLAAPSCIPTAESACCASAFLYRCEAR